MQRSLFGLGAVLLLVGLTEGFHTAAVAVRPTSGVKALVATILGIVFVVRAVGGGDRR